MSAERHLITHAMERWRGRVALVTGASVGIGRGIAVSFLRHGLNVVACARRLHEVELIRADVSGDGVGQLLAIKCDVTVEEEVLAMFDLIKMTLGGVDVCVNNAGLGDVQDFANGETLEWRRMLDTNVLGLALCTREALKSMKERGVDDGHIINISSIAAHVVVPYLVFYSATKHAVRALTEGLRMELAAENSKIRATTISPGMVRTDFYKEMMDKEEVKALHAKLDSENSILEIEDVVSSVEYVLAAPPHVQTHDVLTTPLRKN